MTPAGCEMVRMGELVVRSAREAPRGLAIRGLGSCVAVFIHEPAIRLGGLAHVMLPEPAPRSPLTAPGAFAATAVAALVDALLSRGGRRESLVARVTGGAELFPSGARGVEPLGKRNARAALRALSDQAVVVAGLDIGGAQGRTLHADVDTGRIRVRTLDRPVFEL